MPETLTEFGSRIGVDLRELWRRIAFFVAITTRMTICATTAYFATGLLGGGWHQLSTSTRTRAWAASA